jgi:hypothetical protein
MKIRHGKNDFHGILPIISARLSIYSENLSLFGKRFLDHSGCLTNFRTVDFRLSLLRAVAFPAGDCRFQYPGQSHDVITHEHPAWVLEHFNPPYSPLMSIFLLF